MLARVSGALEPFHEARVPASLHARGVLAYLALASLPSEVIVRAPSGKTVSRESLTASAREVSERCVGEAE